MGFDALAGFGAVLVLIGSLAFTLIAAAVGLYLLLRPSTKEG